MKMVTAPATTAVWMEIFQTRATRRDEASPTTIEATSATNSRGAPQSAARQSADVVLLVGSADMVSLWHARTGLALLQNPLGINPDRVALVVNQHSRRLHHSRDKIEWALGLASAAIIPNDHEAVQHSFATQRPLIFAGRGSAARSLLDLAERI